jgi:hypothetical protein
MAKKNTRSDKSASPTHLPAPDRRRTARATTRSRSTTPDAIIAEPDGSPAVLHTANEMQTQGDGSALPTYEEIAEAAYLRYLQHGGHDGHDFDDWIDAERSLRERR